MAYLENIRTGVKYNVVRVIDPATKTLELIGPMGVTFPRVCSKAELEKWGYKLVREESDYAVQS